jgi:hypothetical protein
MEGSGRGLMDVLFGHLFGGTQKGYEKPQSEWLESRTEHPLNIV